MIRIYEKGFFKMILIEPSVISKIDSFACDRLGISAHTLMLRAAQAIEGAVRSYVPKDGSVCILAGKGNNGGDGYAAAILLMKDYDVTVYDVFSSGQRSDEGRYYLDSYISLGGVVRQLDLDSDATEDISSSDCIIDAVFGTGFVGELPENAKKLANILDKLSDKVIIAVDVPLGVNASSAEVDKEASYHATATVALGFVKPGLVSYPAKEYVGKLIYDNIDLHCDAVLSEFKSDTYYIDYELACSFIPSRSANSNKGTFGKLLMITGSSEFVGAGHLSLETALRAGVGYVTYVGERPMCDSLVQKLPEAIYKPRDVANIDTNLLEEILGLSKKSTAILIGSGCPVSEGLRLLVERLLCEEGSPIILDAGALSVLEHTPDHTVPAIKNSRRKVIITPHPLELSRLSGIPVEDICNHRLSVARSFAARNNCILVLKGAGTIVTDGKITFINSSGSSALAKAGSGDVLAGFLSSVIAAGVDPINAAALAVYFHGRAGDELARDLSEFGVIPSDLPVMIAKQLALAINGGI